MFILRLVHIFSIYIWSVMLCRMITRMCIWHLHWLIGIFIKTKVMLRVPHVLTSCPLK